MCAKMFFGGSAILLAALMTPPDAAQSPSPNSSVSSQVDHQPQAPQSDSAVKVKTRLVKLDVIVENSHGDTARDLKPEEFEVFDRGCRRSPSVRLDTNSRTPQPRNPPTLSNYDARAFIAIRLRSQRWRRRRPSF